MRIVQKLSLAAIVAVAAMALIGVPSASATNTVLCTVNNQLVCPSSSKFEHFEVSGLSTNALMLTSVANIKCTRSILAGKVLLLANPLIMHITLWSLTGCTESIFGSKCTETTNNAGLKKILKIGPNLGRDVTEGSEVLVNCSSIGLHCVYGSPTTALILNGSVGAGLASLTATGVELPKLSGGFFCPESASLDATYTITTPDPLYVAE